MSDIAFLITNRYQIHHYRPIAEALGAPTTFVIEVRDQDFGVDPDFILEHLPNVEIERVHKADLRSLDGRHRLIVCQTPVLPNLRPQRSLLVAQQYSLAKEVYQYGVWRALVDLNLMYGPYSVDQVSGFSHAVAVGNPIFDDIVPGATASETRDGMRGVYLPTYGSLSSLSQVVPVLESVPCEVVVKLHHAEDPAVARALPPNCSVAPPGSDPVELIASADFVVSDLSGAAYDAAYLGRPLLLVGELDRAAPDYSRLSEADRCGSHLSEVSTRWRIGEPIEAALERAQGAFEGDAHEKFRERFFANPGTAGKACAEQIRSLLAHGPPDGFGQRQVRTRLTELMDRVESLSARVTRLEVANSRVLTRPVSGRTRRALRRARAELTRFPRVERSALESKKRLDRRLEARRRAREIGRRTRGSDQWGGAHTRGLPESAPLGPVRPVDRRDELLELLRSAMRSAGLHLGVRQQGQETSCALLHEEKRALVDALQILATEQPRLIVRAGAGSGTRVSSPASALTFPDIFGAHWLRLSLPLPHDHDDVDDHWLTAQFVRPVEDRFLTIDPRAPHVDWTEHFAANRSERPGPTVPLHRLNSEPIDIVYTWVDSSDPEWRARREAFTPEGETLESANNEERFIDRDELRYSLRSVWMHAPFVRHVYLVTAGHSPEWLADSDHLTVVPHEQIFPDDSVLPTFNSHAIEACLHRITGLSEQFIYFNDDVFLGRECSPDDFFTRGALPKVRFSPSQYLLDGVPAPTAIPTHWAAFNARQLIERDFRQTFDRKLQHIPFALTRSTLVELEERYPDEVARTRAARFRSATDLAIPSMLAAYYGIARGHSTEWPSVPEDYIYADTGRQDWLDRRADILRLRPRFFCLNSTKHDQIDLETQAHEVRNLLRDLFPHPSPFEAASTVRTST